MSLTRRSFLQWLAGMGLTGLGVMAIARPGLSASPANRLTREIPISGEKLPVIGLGTWLTFGINPEDQQALSQREKILHEFLRLGGGVLDSSPMYGSAEKVIGLCLKRIGSHKGLFSATKVWTHGARQGFLQMEQSQRLWGLSKLDLMQVHNLVDWQRHLPILRTMKEEGKIRYVGVTTSHGRRHDELISIMRKEQLDFVQFTYNIVNRKAERYLLPLAADKGIAVIINRPFRHGDLFDHVADHPLPAWAGEINCHNWAQFFLKFIVSHPAVTCAIPATSRIDHLQQNMQAAYGPLPDKALRKKMVDTIKHL
jgi:diketogulonate reductase-like aldo/keto reductase